MLRNLDGEYHSRLRDGKGSTVVSPDDANAEATGTTTDTMGGIFDRVGSFVERTSSWSFSDMSNIIATTSGNKEKRQIHHSMIHCRPTAVFPYDWRRPLPELCTALHQFCEDTVSCFLGWEEGARQWMFSVLILILSWSYPPPPSLRFLFRNDSFRISQCRS